jgi:hypothetical protein
MDYKKTENFFGLFHFLALLLTIFDFLQPKIGCLVRGICQQLTLNKTQKTMKKSIVLAAVLVGFLFTSNTVQAQENVLKWNFLSALVKTANFSYERALSDNSSFQLGLYYTGFSIENTNWRGIGITPEYRFYISGEVLDGVYVAPFLRYQNISLTNDGSDGKATLNSFGGGAVIGRQWLFGEKFTLDIFLGPSYTTDNVKVDSGSDNIVYETGSLTGFGLRTGLTFGFAF